jgi:hypothetical protein
MPPCPRHSQLLLYVRQPITTRIYPNASQQFMASLTTHNVITLYLSSTMPKIIPFLSLLFFSGLSFSQPNFSTGFDMVWCGETKVIFNHSCAEEQPGIMFIHVHENEKTAVEAAKKMMDKYGHGCFVTWESQDDRYVRFKLGNDSFRFDPNRIYSAQGLEATLRKNGAYSKEAFEKADKVAKMFLKKYVDSQQLVIAVHNNTEGDLTIRSFQSEAKAIYVNPDKDADDFFLTTVPFIYDYLKKKKFNVVLQKPGIKDDGSLSVYAAKHKIAYLNVEAQHGHLEQQSQMLDAVQELINSKYQ